MALHVIGVMVETLVVEGFRLINCLESLTLVAQAVIGRGQVVIAVGVGGVGLDHLLKLLQSGRVLALFVKAGTGGVLTAGGPLAPTRCDQ